MAVKKGQVDLIVFQQTLSALLTGGLECPPISDFVLNNDHPEILRMEEDSPSSNGARTSKGDGFVFEVDHMQAFQEAGLLWPPSKPLLNEMIGDKISGLSRRSQECIFYHKSLEQSQRLVRSVVDLTKSLPWQVKQAPDEEGVAQVLPCLACSSRPFFLFLGRRMAGVEAMFMQGWSLSDIQQKDGEQRFADGFLFGLAGNAMNANVVMDILICLFTAWSVNSGQQANCAPALALQSVDESSDADPAWGSESEEGEEECCLVHSSQEPLASLSSGGMDIDDFKF